MNDFGGIRIAVNALATARVHKVERMPIRKRRKGYRVVPHDVPAAYRLGRMFGDVLVVHPSIYEAMKTGA